MVSREFRCVSMLPLWFRARSGLFWRVLASSGEPLRLRAATAHAVGRGLRFDARAVVSRELRCVSTLPLWFRANSVAFRRSRCGFARIPASSGLLWPLRILGGPLRLRAATAHAVGRGLRFDAPAVVSREFRCVSTLPLWFRANSVAFRCSRCGFARIPASSGLFWGGHLGSRELLYFWSPGVSVIFRGLLWPLLALLTVWGLRRHKKSNRETTASLVLMTLRIVALSQHRFCHSSTDVAPKVSSSAATAWMLQRMRC